MTRRLTTWASAAGVLVACGGASGPNESSQLVWRNTGDAASIQKILLHEIVHVLHVQLNPLPEVNAIGSLKWLTEGLAYYAAGQLDDARKAELRTLIVGGYAPTSVESIPWGQFARYAFQSPVNVPFPR